MKTQILKHFQHIFLRINLILYFRGNSSASSLNQSIEQRMDRVMAPSRYRLSYLKYYYVKLYYHSFFACPILNTEGWLTRSFVACRKGIVDERWLTLGLESTVTLTCPSHAAVRLVKNSSGHIYCSFTSDSLTLMPRSTQSGRPRIVLFPGAPVTLVNSRKPN